jgi:hypothetical protein
MKMKVAITVLLLGISVINVKSQYNQTIISHYLFTDFIQGQVKLKSGISQSSKLNYNSFTEEMVFERNGNKLALDNLETIDTVIIQDRKFIPVGNVFYEVLENSSMPLFIHHLCSVTSKGKPSGYGGYSETASIDAKAMIYSSSGQVYEMILPSEYNVNPYSEYLLTKDNKYYKISDINSVIKIYPERKAAIKEFVKTHKISFKKSEDLKQLLIFCNK